MNGAVAGTPTSAQNVIAAAAATAAAGLKVEVRKGSMQSRITEHGCVFAEQHASIDLRECQLEADDFDGAISKGFMQHCETAKTEPGQHVAAFLAAVSRQGPPTEVLYDGHPKTSECASATLSLLNFADYADTLFNPTGTISHPELAKPGMLADALGAYAVFLHGQLVQRLADIGDTPWSWASACRNAVAIAFAFPLIAQKDAEALVGELSSRGVSLIVDPFAGTGLIARLLGNAGVEVQASDARPGGIGKEGVTWYPVSKLLAEEISWDMPNRKDVALLLSWPPRLSESAATSLACFPGNYVVYVGDSGQWTGSESFHKLLASDWREVWNRKILQWPRMGDDIRIFERNNGGQRQHQE